MVDVHYYITLRSNLPQLFYHWPKVNTIVRMVYRHV